MDQSQIVYCPLPQLSLPAVTATAWPVTSLTSCFPYQLPAWL